MTGTGEARCPALPRTKAAQSAWRSDRRSAEANQMLVSTSPAQARSPVCRAASSERSSWMSRLAQAGSSESPEPMNASKGSPSGKRAASNWADSSSPAAWTAPLSLGGQALKLARGLGDERGGGDLAGDTHPR